MNATDIAYTAAISLMLASTGINIWASVGLRKSKRYWDAAGNNTVAIDAMVREGLRVAWYASQVYVKGNKEMLFQLGAHAMKYQELHDKAIKANEKLDFETRSFAKREQV